MSFRLVVKIAALASTCWMSIGAALAENRMALVIGNANYVSASSLPNPANDAKAMAKFLDEAGFEVHQAPDLRQGAMLRTIGNFARLVAGTGPDTVALVYYAGHGLQVDGENYLVPVDAAIRREADVPLQAMRFGDLMNALSSVPTKALIVILDACRNNPFAEIKDATGRGLAIVDAPSGSLISYSTSPGTEALDGDGRNSPYTAALLKVGREEGLPIEQALKRVRLAVNEATSKQQVPWETSSLTSEFSFFPGAGEGGNAGTKVAIAPAANAPAEAKSQARSVESWQKELKSLSPRAAYASVIREDTVEAYEAYLLDFPSDSLAAVVRRILERRQEMIAWNDAVTVNTPQSYETFLTRHGDSDYASTAQRLKKRPRLKPAALALGPTGPDASAVVVDTPVVTPVPVFDPPYWRHRRPPHEGEHDNPGKVTKHDKPSKVDKPVKVSKETHSERRDNAVNRRTTVNRVATFNRPITTGFHPAGGMGFGGGHHR